VLRRGASWSTIARRLIRALAWGGKARSQSVLAQLRSQLSAATIEELKQVRNRVPTWMAQELSSLVATSV
jgi:isopentenyl diphosphate isomerase/L-lactate dehydrogenase-like FMN-dependent dehydrogenase